MIAPVEELIKNFLINWVYPCKNCNHENCLDYERKGNDFDDYDLGGCNKSTQDLIEYVYCAHIYKTCKDCGEPTHIIKNDQAVYCDKCEMYIHLHRDRTVELKERYNVDLDKLLNQ